MTFYIVTPLLFLLAIIDFNDVLGYIKGSCNDLKLHSTLIIEAMKVTLVLCTTLALVSSQGCPELAPVTCGKDMMNCPGMNDVNGCPTAGSCMPTKGGTY